VKGFGFTIVAKSTRSLFIHGQQQKQRIAFAKNWRLEADRTDLNCPAIKNASFSVSKSEKPQPND